MLLEEDFKEWCSDEGLSAPVWIDTDPPESLNRCFRMSITGGLGLEAEYALDRPTFEIRTRGTNLGDSRDLALEFDALWLNQQGPFYIGEAWVLGTGRLSGPPRYLYTEDRSGRVVRAATYWCRIGR